MSYRIIIEKEHPASEGERLPKIETIYQQRIIEIDLIAIISAVNRMQVMSNPKTSLKEQREKPNG